MKDLISREALALDVRRNLMPNVDADGTVSVEDAERYFLSRIEKAPAVDAVEVVHARWVGLEYDGYADGSPVYYLWECSACGEEVQGEDVPITHPWCHGCGARMDGE